MAKNDGTKKKEGFMKEYKYEEFVTSFSIVCVWFEDIFDIIL